MTENKPFHLNEASLSAEDQQVVSPSPQSFLITQSHYQFRQYLVTALNYKEAMEKLLEAAPVDAEVSFFTETEDVNAVADDESCHELFIDEIISVDSEDQSETYYERP